MTESNADPAPETGWWQRMVPWWHAWFAATVTVTVALALLTGAPALVLLPLGLLVVDYVALGAHALRSDAQRHAIAYFALAAALLAWTVALHPAGLLLLIGLYPQCFAMLSPFARAAAAAVVLTAAGYVSNAQREGWTHASVTDRARLRPDQPDDRAGDRLVRGPAAARVGPARGTRAALTAAQQELADAQHLAGVQAERERLAREIHDTLAQGFTSIVMLARRDRRAGSTNTAPARDKLALLEETAQANLAEARALVAALPPADLTEGGLLGALRRATDRCARENGVAAELSVRGTAARAGVVVRRRVVARRAGGAGQRRQALAGEARRDDVTYGSTETSLEVRDDGVGLDRLGCRVASAWPACGSASRRRAASCAVEATPGGGTTVRVVLPSPFGAAARMNIRVLLVDDHPVVRFGLRGLLDAEDDLEVVGEASDGREAVDLCRVLHPDVVLMDLRMPGGDGTTATARLAEEMPDVRVLVLTTFDGDGDILRAVEAGAKGYLLKDTPRDVLTNAVRAAARGETVLAPPIAARLMRRLSRPASESLTAREVEVLRAVARGRTNAADRARALHRRGDRQDTPAADLRQARGRRPHPCRDGRHAPRAARQRRGERLGGRESAGDRDDRDEAAERRQRLARPDGDRPLSHAFDAAHPRRLLGHVGRQQVDLQRTRERHRPARRRVPHTAQAPSRTRSRATSGCSESAASRDSECLTTTARMPGQNGSPRGRRTGRP